MLVFGALLCAIGSLAFGLADSLAMAYFGRTLIGAGAAFGFVGTLKLATVWFPAERFAQLTGMTMMVGMLGGVAGQAPLAAVVEATGWRGTQLAAAGVGAAIALAIWLLVRDRRPGDPPPAAAESAAGLWRGLVTVVRMPQIWVLSLVTMAMAATLLAFASLWGVAWLMQTRGLARPEAAALTSLTLIGLAIGSPLLGALSDRLRRRKLPLQLGLASALVCLSALLYLPQLPAALLALLFFVTGLGIGVMSVSYAVARELTPPSATGAAYGLLNGFLVGSGAVFQPLIGALLDSRWDGRMEAGARVYSAAAYQTALSVLVVCLVLGLLATLLLRETGRGRGAI